MSKERFDLGKSTLVHVTECNGDLVIRPWMELDVQANGDYTADVVDGQLSFKASGDLGLNVPENTSIQLDQGKGDVVIRSISGDITLNNVSGDLILNNLNAAKVGHVSGDLVASNFSNPLAVERVDGDMVCRNIDGDVSVTAIRGDVLAQFINGSLSIAEGWGDINVRSVNGDIEIKSGRRDLNLHSIGGRCRVEQIAGDIRLLGGLGPFDHSLVANGDVVLIWPTDAPLLLEAEASSIVNRLPLVDLVESEGKLNGRIGDGKTRLSISAGGQLVLKEAQLISKKWNFNGEEFFNSDFFSDLSDWGTNLGAKISSIVNDEVTQDVARRMAEQLSQKAEAAAEKAAEMAGITVERVFDGQTSIKKTKEESKPSSAEASSNKSGYEARLKILKMVEEGVISPDEANMLLDALEGD